MATEKQITANRQNATCSTGPRTKPGRHRSRRNALRHGLTAETVIDVLEDASAYKALQRKIYADYRPQTNFELELVARLVSLLWRLRRAVAIESGLMDIQATASGNRLKKAHYNSNKLELFYTMAPPLALEAFHSNQAHTDLGAAETDEAESTAKRTFKSRLADSFVRSLQLDSSVFDRLGRYEMRLWRQVVQILLLLNSINCGSNSYGDGTHLRLRNAVAKRHRVLWPPFTLAER
jgi:hypothetical protein